MVRKLHLLSETSAKGKQFTAFGVLLEFQTCQLLGSLFHDLTSLRGAIDEKAMIYG